MTPDLTWHSFDHPITDIRDPACSPLKTFAATVTINTILEDGEIYSPLRASKFTAEARRLGFTLDQDVNTCYEPKAVAPAAPMPADYLTHVTEEAVIITVSSESDSSHVTSTVPALPILSSSRPQPSPVFGLPIPSPTNPGFVPAGDPTSSSLAQNTRSSTPDRADLPRPAVESGTPLASDATSPISQAQESAAVGASIILEHSVSTLFAAPSAVATGNLPTNDASQAVTMSLSPSGPAVVISGSSINVGSAIMCEFGRETACIASNPANSALPRPLQPIATGASSSLVASNLFLWAFSSIILFVMYLI